MKSVTKTICDKKNVLKLGQYNNEVLGTICEKVAVILVDPARKIDV